jgi:regulator of protease activity HflC (stomatin/prohibitin superfamily)
MFDKLIEIVQSVWSELKPYYIVTEMETACILRFGKYHHTSEAGIHWKIPFADYIYSYHTRTQTTHLAAQTLTSFDGKSIVVKAIVRFNIFDVEAYTLRVWDAHDAINDTVQGIIGNIVKTHNWETIIEGIEEEITEKSAAQLAEWGIEVEKVTLSDLGIIRTVRLINDSTTHI